MTMARRMRAKTLPGMSVRREFSAKSQAQITTKDGFMNSEGWIDRPTMLSQRREPLFSTPTNRTASISTSEMHNTMSATRRACRGVRNDVAIITPSAGRKNAMWRLTKWKLS